jgi:hypothetical protein
VRKNPSLTTTVLVTMQDLLKQTLRIAPVVNSFTLNKYGKNTELIFNSSYYNGGKNIFWSILREGRKHLCFLVTLADCKWVSTVGNVSTMLNHFITEQDFLQKKVRIFLLH